MFCSYRICKKLSAETKYRISRKIVKCLVKSYSSGFRWLRAFSVCMCVYSKVDHVGRPNVGLGVDTEGRWVCKFTTQIRELPNNPHAHLLNILRDLSDAIYDLYDP